MGQRLLLCLIFTCISLPAATLEYTDRQLWEEAVGNTSTIDFQGASTTTSVSGIPTLTIGAVTFSGLTGLGTGLSSQPFLQVMSVANNSWVAAWGSGDALMAGESGMSVALPPGTKAFGFDLISTFLFFVPYPMGSFFNVGLSLGESFVAPDYAPPQHSFVGFVSTDDLSTVYLNSSGTFPMIDNFSLPDPQVTPTPEPSVAITFLTGLLLLGCCVRTALTDPVGRVGRRRPAGRSLIGPCIGSRI